MRQETWSATCTCPGAESARESFRRNQEIRRVAAAIDMSDHPDAGEIESRLRAVFEEHGQPPPPGTTTWSRLLAARAESRFASRAGYRAAGVVATAAVALTVAAVVSTGRRRLLWSGAAAAAWAVSGYAVSLVTALAGIARSAEAQARVEDLRSR